MAERPVTISVSYPVAVSEQDEFEAWSRLRLAESADRPGYLGGQVLAPPAPGPDWFIVHRFENERAASNWETWFQASAGWQQAGDIEWKVDTGPTGTPEPRNGNARNGNAPPPLPPNGRIRGDARTELLARPGQPSRGGGQSGADGRPYAAGRPAAAPEPPRPAGPRPARPEPGARPTATPDADRPRPGATGPNGFEGPRRGGPPGQGAPPRAAPPPPATPGKPPGALVAPPAPPRQAGPPPAESRPRDHGRANQGPEAPGGFDRRAGQSAAGPGEGPSQVASMVVTAAVVILFVAAFETVVAPAIAGGPVLLRIALLSVVVTLAITVVRPPGLRRWLANLLVPVAVRNRREAGATDREPPTGGKAR